MLPPLLFEINDWSSFMLGNKGMHVSNGNIKAKNAARSRKDKRISKRSKIRKAERREKRHQEKRVKAKKQRRADNRKILKLMLADQQAADEETLLAELLAEELQQLADEAEMKLMKKAYKVLMNNIEFRLNGKVVDPTDPTMESLQKYICWYPRYGMNIKGNIKSTKENYSGYTQIHFKRGEQFLAHKLMHCLDRDEPVSYKKFRSAFGFDCSHLCHNSACFNPQHIHGESHRNNMQRNRCTGLVFARNQNTLFNFCCHETKCLKFIEIDDISEFRVPIDPNQKSTKQLHSKHIERAKKFNDIWYISFVFINNK